VAAATERIEIGPTVTNLAARHVTVTASAARAVAEAAPNRFILGLGAGDRALGFGGLRHARVGELETGVRRLRSLMAGDGVAFDGIEARLRDATDAPAIYVAACGPRTLEMAGRVADGVIVIMGGVAEKLAISGAGPKPPGGPRRRSTSTPPAASCATCRRSARR